MMGILSDLEKIQHEGCKRAKPDPEALAKRLFERELGGDYSPGYARTTPPRSHCRSTGAGSNLSSNRQITQPTRKLTRSSSRRVSL
jgi:hypothetical protein